MDCDQLTGRQRDICRGHDDDGNPIEMPEEQRRKYLARWSKRKNRKNLADCIHRGPVAGMEPCKVCNNETKLVEVHYCRLHGSCTSFRTKLGDEERQYPACSQCSDFQAPERQAITLRVGWSPGDNVVATVVPYELQKQYPGRFDITIRTHYPQIWENNPHIVGTEEAQNDDDGDPRWFNLNCEYLLNHSWSRPVHYVEAMVWDIRRKLALPALDVTDFRGHVYLSDEEKAMPNQVEEVTGDPSRPWWLLVSGGKRDCTVKWYNPRKLQEVVDHFAGRVRFVQVGALEHDSGGHEHFELSNVVDLRGQTDHAQLRRLVWHADGVISLNSYLMHLAAAVDDPHWRPWRRPCIVLGGGRENPNWYHYPAHTVLHRIGALPCCGWGGCWKDRVIPVGDGRPYDEKGHLCEKPSPYGFAGCMEDISPEEIILAVEKHLKGMA